MKEIDTDVVEDITKIKEEEEEQVSNHAETKKQPPFMKFFQSFRRQEEEDDDDDDDDDKDHDDLESCKDTLKHSIKPRHTVMITLGTGIGTGLLVGTGTVLSQAGPLGLIIGYIVSSIMVYLILQAAGELGLVYSHVVGNFTRYPSELIDPAFGFSISIIYTFQWMTVLPLQLVTAAMVIEWWQPGINLDWFVLIVFLVVVAINLGGARGYVEAEFICNLCKILMISGFIILGIVIICGGTSGTQGSLGGVNWVRPGLFAHGFKGVATVFCYAAFSYGGVETVILTAAEQTNPTVAIPRATRVVVIRILLIYLLTLIIICFLVPYDNVELLGSGKGGGESGSSSSSSPFVIAVSIYGIKVIPHILNAVILISVISVANSSLYAAPRLLLSLSQEGVLPRQLQYIDRSGRPLICFLIVVLMGCLGFVATSPHREDIFIWLLSISGLGQIYIWMSICLSHIRYKQLLKKGGVPTRGDDTSKKRYKATFGIYGSIIALIISLFVLSCQFWVALYPINKSGGGGGAQVISFFQNYLAFPILIITYLGYKIYCRDWRVLIPAEEITLPGEE